MSGAGDHKGRPYGFIVEFTGLDFASFHPGAGSRTRKEQRVVGDGLVPSRRALRARVENAPHSRWQSTDAGGNPGAGEHNAPARVRGRPYATELRRIAVLNAGRSCCRQR